MREYPLPLTVLLSLFVLTVSLPAQETEEKADKKEDVQFGIGVIFNNFWQDFSYDNNLPTLYFPINIHKKFKVEPEVSYYNNTRNNESIDQKESAMRIGLGLFGITNYEKSLFYYGLRFSYNYYKTEYSTPVSDNRERTSKRFMLGPALGGEYFFVKHFSLGAEVGFQFTIKKDEESNYNYYFPTSDVTATQVFIFLRFYF